MFRPIAVGVRVGVNVAEWRTSAQVALALRCGRQPRETKKKSSLPAQKHAASAESTLGSSSKSSDKKKSALFSADFGGEGGFEPPKSLTTDLQYSGSTPKCQALFEKKNFYAPRYPIAGRHSAASHRRCALCRVVVIARMTQPNAPSNLTGCISHRRGRSTAIQAYMRLRLSLPCAERQLRQKRP